MKTLTFPMYGTSATTETRSCRLILIGACSTMKTTQKHYLYWTQRRNQVSWYTPKPVQSISIDRMIPEAPRDKARDPHFTASNLVSLLKSKRARGEDLLLFLLSINSDPGTIIQPQKRKTYARQWAGRLLDQQAKRGGEYLPRSIYVKKRRPYDGSKLAGDPTGPVLRIVELKDWKVDGAYKPRAYALLSDGTCDFTWNLYYL